MKQELAEQDMSREQENSHPESDLTMLSTPTSPCRLGLPLFHAIPGLVYVEVHCNPDTTNAVQRQTGQRVKRWANFGARCLLGQSFHGSPEEDNKGVLLTAQTHFTVMPLLSLNPQILVKPLIRLGMK